MGAKEVGRWGVGFPPEDVGVGGEGVGPFDEGGEGELRGNDAALVVDTHEEAEGGVEDDPGDPEVAAPVCGGGEADAGEEQGDAWEQESRFLVRNQA